MKKILITGANSYIGTSVEKYLNKYSEKYQVTTLDTVGLEPTPQMFEDYDTVFHVAGIAHIKETKKNESLYYKVNRDLTLKIADCAKKGKVKQFIVLSSMSVYGKETGCISKASKPAPVNAYGRSKLQADERLIQESCSDFKVAVLRPPMVYGNGCKGNYQLLYKLAMTTPFFPSYDNQRSMIYIGNLCEFVKGIIDEAAEGIFFPQNSEFVCTSNMVRLIAEKNNRKIHFTKAFNWIIKVLPFSVFRKVFGSLVYEKTDTVDKYSLEESILQDK